MEIILLFCISILAGDAVEARPDVEAGSRAQEVSEDNQLPAEIESELRIWLSQQHDRGSQDAMAPPWVVFPHIPAGSIGWRMGGGEDYNNQFGDWFAGLAEVSRANYMNRFPEPDGWDGYYERKISRRIPRE